MDNCFQGDIELKSIPKYLSNPLAEYYSEDYYESMIKGEIRRVIRVLKCGDRKRRTHNISFLDSGVMLIDSDDNSKTYFYDFKNIDAAMNYYERQFAGITDFSNY